MESLNNFDIAGAIEAQIIQEKAMNLKKGSLVVIKDRPCRVNLINKLSLTSERR